MKISHFIFVAIVAALFVSSVTAMSRLRTNGRSIVNEQNQVVQLKGVNLGGWFVLEDFMSPIDERHSCSDSYCVMNKLNNRFGVDKQQELMRAYQETWIQEQDIQNIREAGFNTVRIPLWWGQFFKLDNPTIGGFRGDAWDLLDRVVEWCERHEIYIVWDLHGAVGSQSTAETTGQANRNEFFSNNQYQSITAWLWWQIANRYTRYNSVAGYDLLNEPDPRWNPTPAHTGGWSDGDTKAIWNVYKWFYESVRSVSDQIIFVEGTYNDWDWNVLPHPNTYGWTNVVYSFHEYQWPTTNSVENIKRGVDNQINDFNNHADWNVPGFINEWNGFKGYSDTFGYAIDRFNSAGLSWTMWSYKAVNGACGVADGSFWGWYCIRRWDSRPTLDTDSADDIAKKWRNWSTSALFDKNSMMNLHP